MDGVADHIGWAFLALGTFEHGGNIPWLMGEGEMDEQKKRRTLIKGAALMGVPSLFIAWLISISTEPVSPVVYVVIAIALACALLFIGAFIFGHQRKL